MINSFNLREESLESMVFTSLKKACFVLVFLMLSPLEAKNYERVVSLASSLSKIIYFLEAEEKLVGCTSFCLQAKKDNKQVVASAKTVNTEALLQLKPDLVLATGLTSPEQIELLKKFNIEVKVFNTAKSFEGILEQYLEIGRLLGEEERARKQVLKIKEELETLKLGLSKKKKKRIFFQIGANPIFVVTKNTYMDDFITLSHGENSVGDFTQGTLSREAVIKQNPDYIVIASMGSWGEEEKKEWEKFEGMNAIKNKNIFIIDPDLACTPTPQTFIATLRILAEKFRN